MLDEIEKWVVEHYGRIEMDSVEFGQFGFSITAVAVPLLNSKIQIGMGQNRQLAIHDLYLQLTQRPTLKTSLPVFWQERRAELSEIAAFNSDDDS